jgi:hypothetical protein
MVVITYANMVWWPTVKYKTSRTNLSKLKMLACLGITGAMRILPTAATEVPLQLPSLHM